MLRAEEDVYRFAQIRDVFQLRISGADIWNENYASIQHVEITEPVDKVDRVLNRVYPRCGTENENAHTTGFDSMSRGSVKDGEWYDLVPLSSVVYVILVARFKYAVKDLA